MAYVHLFRTDKLFLIPEAYFLRSPFLYDSESALNFDFNDI